jgi:excisionase family DNA binding protein
MLIPIRLGLTIKEAAARLKCTPKTIYRLVNTGQLDALALGPQQWAIPEAFVTRYEKDRGDKRSGPVRNTSQRTTNTISTSNRRTPGGAK